MYYTTLSVLCLRYEENVTLLFGRNLIKQAGPYAIGKVNTGCVYHSVKSSYWTVMGRPLDGRGGGAFKFAGQSIHFQVSPLEKYMY